MTETAPPEVAAPSAPPEEATTPEAIEASPWPSSEARLLDDCLWYADASTPPSEGPGSLEELDERLGVLLSGTALVVGRVRLAARGCPTISAGLVLTADPDADDPETSIALIGMAEDRSAIAGARGDERRDRPWASSGALGDDDSDCDETDLSTLHLFRALHASSGAIEELETTVLATEVCTLFAHDLVHGDLDRDGTTEIRVQTRTSSLMDMSAGRERMEMLRIYDLAALRMEVRLVMGELQADEVEFYGATDTHGEIAMRDLDDDGDRDLILRVRGTYSERSDDDRDQLVHSSFSSEAYAYDADRDEYRRAPDLDERISGAP